MHTWLKKNLKYILPVLFVAVVLFVLVAPLDVSAQLTITKEEPGRVMKIFVLPILNGILNMFSLLLAFAALLLELIVDLTIVKMRLLLEGNGTTAYPGIQSIDLAWRTIRDVANIIFVFVLLLISINIILGSWGKGPYDKGLIPKVIIAALLINFSLFFTKVVIDVSNLTAYEFYKTASNIRGEGGTKIFGVIPTTGLTTSIMNGLQISAFVNDQGKIDTGSFGSVQSNYPFFSTILGILVVLVAAFVLFVMAFLLLIRFILFIVLMVTSPIAFIGELLPQLSGHSKKWWKTLADQATFAPVFFILILVVVVIINDDGFRSFGAGLTSAAGGVGPYFAKLLGVMIQYAIVIGLLVVALVAAKQTAGKTGEGFVKWGSKWAGKATMGTTAALGRNTLGRAGDALANSAFAGNLAKSKYGSALGKGLILGGDKLRNYTYDARAIKAVSGGDFGAGDVGVKGGLVGARKARAEQIEARGKTYAQAMGVAAQRNEIEKKKAEVEDARKNSQWDKLTKAEGELTAAQSVLNEMQGKKIKEREDLAKASAALTNAQRGEADTAMKVIDAREKYIKELEQSAKLAENEDKKREFTARAQQAKTGLDNYLNDFYNKQGDSASSIKTYIAAQKDVSKIVKSASGQVSASQRAYGETLSGGAFVSTRQAGDALRKGKEKPEDALAKEILNVMKQQETSSSSSEKTSEKKEPEILNAQGKPVDSSGNTKPPENPPKIIT